MPPSKAAAAGLPFSATPVRIALVLGVVLVLTGLGFFLAWPLRWLAGMPASLHMVMSAAAAMAVGGVGLVGWALQPSRRLASCCGLVVTGLGLAVLGEYVSGVTLPVDLVEHHRWLADFRMHDGRMAVPMALAVAMAGLVLAGSPLRGRGPWLAASRLLSQGVVVAALWGVVADFVEIELLYDWGSAARMSLVSAACLATLGAALLLLGREDHLRLAPAAPSRDPVTPAALLLLTAVALATGILVYKTSSAAHERSLGALAAHDAGQRAALLLSMLDVARGDTDALLGGDDVQAHLRQALEGRGTAPLARLLSQRLTSTGMVGVHLLDGNGHVLAQAGSLSEAAGQRATLQGQRAGRLLWTDGYRYVESRPLGGAARRGTLVVEHRLGAFDMQAALVPQPGVFGGHYALCAREGGWLRCFPQRGQEAAATLRLSDLPERPPILSAIEGRAGTVRTLDMNRQAVICAFLPVGDTGLAVGYKIQLRELLAPLRGDLQWSAFVVVLMVLGGGLILRVLVQPLVGRILGDRARAETTVDRLNEIIATQSLLAQSSLDLDLFLEATVNSMLKLTPASGAIIEMIEGDEMVYRAASGTARPHVGMRLARRSSLSGLCVSRGTLLVSHDTRLDPRVDEVACRRLGASIVVAPLLRAGQPVGVLKLLASQAHAFDEAHVQTLRLMAGLLGAALGHAMQFERNETLLRQRAEALDALGEELRRRQAYEAEILSSRQRTQTIIESSQEAFIAIGEDGRVTDWNMQAAAVFGWAKTEVLGRPLDELIIPERFRQGHRHGLAHYVETGRSQVVGRRVELPGLHRDGREIPLELTITPIRHGDEVEFSCFLRDISDRQRHEALMHKQQETLRAITDAIPALVAFIDHEGRFRYANRRHQEFLGVPPQELVGRGLREFFGAEPYRALAPHVQAALRGEPSVFEMEVVGIQGRRHMEAQYIPQSDENGQVTGFYAIVRDITERKLRELHLESRASTDAMTGLLNRAFFLEALDLALRRHRRTHEALALLYLDVDHFKQINDTHGHAAGDAVLVAFAQAIKSSVRESDIVGRLGGDEFCVALDNVKSPSNAAAVAEKIRQAVSQTLWVQGRPLTISTSIGIAYTEMPALPAQRLIPIADAALYQAKQAGRNRHVLTLVPTAQEHELAQEDLS